MPRLRLDAVLGLNKTGFDAGIASATKQVERFGAGARGVLARAFSAAAVVSFTKSIIDLGGEVKDAMDRLGVGARDVQEFQLAAKLGGQDAAVFARALEKVRLAMVEGVASGKNPLAMFGVTMQQLRSGDAVGILRQLASEMDNFAGNADATRALADVFGAKGMGGVVNMLRELKTAGKGNLFLSNEEVELLDRAGDSLTRLWNNLKVIGARLLFPDPADSPLGRRLGMKSKRSAATTGTFNVEGIAAQQEESEKAAKELAKMEDDLAAQIEKNRVAQMTDEERLNDLMAQRVQLIKELGFALTKEAEAAIQLKIAQNAGEIIAAQGRIKAPTEKARRGFTPEESPLGRIGAFSGGGSQNTSAAQGLQSLRRIEAALMQKGILVRDTR